MLGSRGIPTQYGLEDYEADRSTIEEIGHL
ncbi:MAG: hypothetical protein V1764_06515 [Nitrospirota bacterium]